ncbi:MAG: S41 family peptidase [Williamsia sp.]|nr:S41 family peptidase [Williamsia sp.]
MKNTPFFALLTLIVLSLTSCSKQLIGTPKGDSPVQTFETLWKDFDEHYGSFIPKQIDWQAQYNKFRPLVSDTMGNRSLFTVLTRMLDTLNDNHVYLRPTKETGLPWYSGGILGRTAVDDFDKKVAQSYLSQKTVYSPALEYGMFPGNIGYINIIDFGENFNRYPAAMDEILSRLKDTKGIVIELRENGGGEDRVAQYIADRFASSRHFSFSSSVRNGPRHSDFSAPVNFYTQPAGTFQYTKPVVMLTNLNVFSTGETFILAMKQNGQVKIAGGITGGAFSDAVTRDLPNGWSYRLSIADVRDAQGRNLEGIGIEPAYPVKNTRSELEQGKDKALEKALQLLQ